MKINKKPTIDSVEIGANEIFHLKTIMQYYNKHFSVQDTGDKRHQEALTWVRTEIGKLTEEPKNRPISEQIDAKMRTLSGEERQKVWQELQEEEPRFTKNFAGVVYDAKTGLEWYAGPDKDTTWDNAKSWVEKLSLDGGDWRLPTRDELKSLYKENKGTRNMTPLLKTTGWWVWSGESEKGSSSAWVFDFYYGIDFWYNRSNSNNNRGFAVRSRK